MVVTARTEAALERFRAETPRQIRLIAGDITDPALAKTIAETAESEFGQINGLVINHGIMEPVERIAESTAEKWRKCFDINLFSAISLVSPADFFRSQLTDLRYTRYCPRCAKHEVGLS